MEKLLLLTCGIYNLTFAVFHLFFWKMFQWDQDLTGNSKANRAIIQIRNIQMIYILALVGILYIVYSDQLCETKIGIFFMIGLLWFWIGRTIEQFIFFGVNSRIEK